MDVLCVFRIWVQEGVDRQAGVSSSSPCLLLLYKFKLADSLHTARGHMCKRCCYINRSTAGSYVYRIDTVYMMWVGVLQGWCFAQRNRLELFVSTMCAAASRG